MTTHKSPSKLNLSFDEQWLHQVLQLADGSVLCEQANIVNDAYPLSGFHDWSSSFGTNNDNNNHNANPFLDEVIYDFSGNTSSVSPEEVQTPPSLPLASQHNVFVLAECAPESQSTTNSLETHLHNSHNTAAPLSSSTAVHWTDSMSSTAAGHSNFFGLDVAIDNNSFNGIDLPVEVFERAQRTLEAWSDLTPADSASNLTPMVPSTATVKSTSTSGSRSSSSSPKLTSSQSSPVLDTNQNKSAKVTKTFHFVENSDKKTATRLRNTMASRNLRQSKVNRIAQLEKELEKQLQEAEIWKRRAIAAGWNE